ncbi:MAG: heme ABC transporter permease/ATP-binding protein CydD [Aeromonas sp.]
MDKSQQKKLYGWLRQQSGHGRHAIRLAVLCGLGQGVLLIAQAGLIAHLLHSFIQLQQAPKQHLSAFAALAAVMLGKAVLSFAREQYSVQAGCAVRQVLRRAVLTRLTELGPAYIQRRPAGSWASLLLEQIENMQDFFARYLPQMAVAVLIPVLFLGAILPVNWAAGLILLATAPLIPIFMILVGVSAADANRRNFQALARLSGHFLDRLKGLSTLQLFMATEAQGAEIKQASEDFRQRTMEVLRLAFLSTAVLEFFAAISVALAAVYFGFSYLEHLNFGAYGTKVTLFTGLFVLFLAPEFYAPLRELGTHYHAKAQAIGAAEQLVEFLTAEVICAPSGQAPFNARAAFSIEARNLTVLSPEGKVLVGPLNFTLAASSRTALVGLSGAGKSSLVNALLGFAPYRGDIFVDGQRLADLQPSAWRAALGWLGQNPPLFYGSLRENLALAAPAASDSALVAALTAANAAELVREKGLDAPLGDGSSGLSVGQAQRVALARLLLKPHYFMLLDEPTASLDRGAERAVLASLAQASVGKTVLTVTHRLDDLAQMDQILLLDQGQLLEAGSFAQLSAAGGDFARLLARHQAQVKSQGVSFDV